MALEDLLAEIYLRQTLAGIGESFQTSNLPEYIHLFANWGIVLNGNKVVLSNPDENVSTPVLFGDEKMYPPVFRKNQSYDNIEILPGLKKTSTPLVSSPGVTISLSGTDILTYCYALEIVMNIKRSDNGTFLGYEGIGGFTMSYNPQAADTGNYSLTFTSTNAIYTTESLLSSSGVDVTLDRVLANVYPTTLNFKDGSSQNGMYYLTAKYYPKTGGFYSDDYTLTIYLSDAQSKKPDIKLIEYNISDVQSPSFSELPISSHLTQTFGDGIITDLQLILPSEEKGKTREDIVNHYAFDYANMGETNQIIIKPAYVDTIKNLVANGPAIIKRAYAICMVATADPTSITTAAIVQPIYLNTRLYYDIYYPPPTATSYPIYSTIAPYSLTGYGTRNEYQEPTLRFYGGGAYNADAKINGSIDWTLVTTRSRSNISSNSLSGKMTVYDFTVTGVGESGVPTVNRNYVPDWWKNDSNPVKFDSTLSIYNFGAVTSYELIGPSQLDFSILASHYTLPGSTSTIPSYPIDLEFIMMVGYQQSIIEPHTVASPSGAVTVTHDVVNNTGFITTLVDYTNLGRNTALYASTPNGINILLLMNTLRNSRYVNIPCFLIAKIDKPNPEDTSDNTIDAWPDFATYTGTLGRAGVRINPYTG